jgi:hypothetical protein
MRILTPSFKRAKSPIAIRSLGCKPDKTVT